MPRIELMQRLRHRVPERKLVQWAIAYLAGAWLCFQLLEGLGGAFGWPPIVLQISVVLMGFGLVGVMLTAWYHGERGRQHVSGPELLMLALLLFIAGGVAWNLSSRGARNAPEPAPETPAAGAPIATPDRASVAVLPFDYYGPEEHARMSDGLTEGSSRSSRKCRG